MNLYFFHQMFEAVTRVAGVFIQLCDSGCFKYLTWRVRFDCNLDHGPCAFKETVANVEEQCRKMEDDLRKWKVELSKKRSEFPTLNFYTVRQLLMLQIDLKDAILEEDLRSFQKLPARVYSLLDAVYPGIREKSFHNILWKSSHRRRYGEREAPEDSWMTIASKDDKFNATSLEALDDFITRLEEEGHDFDVAKAATMQCGLSDRAKASAWAYQYYNDEDLITRLASEMDEILERKEEEGPMYVTFI